MEEENKKTKLEQAEEIIKRHVYWSLGSGLIPIPFADVAAVTAIQLDMLKSICDLYEIDYSEEQGKSWVAALTGSTLARAGASALKIIPGIGTLLGAATMSALSGASTYAVGQVFAKHFEEGGTGKNLNLEKVKEFYEEMVKEGKEVVEKYKKSKKEE